MNIQVASDRPPIECSAPTTHLRFETRGLVFACCRNTRPLGNVRTDSLREIWTGVRRRELVASLDRGDASLGCQSCAGEIELEGRAGSYAATFDQWAVDRLAGEPEWPRRFEFNLSNACNLQCVQCDGESSSAIRIHRERLPPLPPVYGESFFDELIEFLPHLDEVMFGGGEPFLASENFAVWDRMIEHAPGLPCTVVTNATQWNARVERILESLVVSPVISLDAIRQDTFERIRLGASYDAVMANVDRLVRIADERGGRASVNFCLMQQNYTEFAELLRWADDRNVKVNTLVVREPTEFSIAQADAATIDAVAACFERDDAGLQASLGLNLATWNDELRRVVGWRDEIHRAGAGHSGSHTILQFACAGTGPLDDSAAIAELAAEVGVGVDAVYRFTVDRSERIVDVSPNVGDRSAQLIGRTIPALLPIIGPEFGGDLLDYEVVAQTADRLDARATFPAGSARIAIVPLRDASGWADSVRFLLAFAPVTVAAPDSRGRPRS